MRRIDANVLFGPGAHAPLLLLGRTVGRIPHELIDAAVGTFDTWVQGHGVIDDTADVPYTHFETE